MVINNWIKIHMQDKQIIQAAIKQQIDNGSNRGYNKKAYYKENEHTNKDEIKQYSSIIEIKQKQRPQMKFWEDPFNGFSKEISLW